MTRGWWDMPCWEGLTPDQQEFVRTEGYLPFGYREAGECQSGAEVEVTTMWDEYPGPRFYCRACAAMYLSELEVGREEAQEATAGTRRRSAQAEAEEARRGHRPAAP